MSKQKKLGIVGHFGFGYNLLNGQTIKTKTITNALETKFGENEVVKLDTHGGIKFYLMLPFQLFRLLKRCKNVIIFPAHRGVRIITPILSFWNKLFKRGLHYCVIGGWLPDMLKTKRRLAKRLKKFDGIYVETNTMKTALEEQGFANIFVMPNCKDLHILKENELVYNSSEPYKLCTFSRVMKEKGIEDAVNAVKTVNEKFGRTVYTLDIYGQVNAGQAEWFENLKASFPDYIKYGGLVEYNKSVDVLKDYFALLFPTRFYTEGIPGTIVDAYAAGVPVISSMWMNFSEIIDIGITGFGYTFDTAEVLIEILNNVAINPSKINDMKPACLIKAFNFSAKKVVADFIKEL